MKFDIVYMTSIVCRAVLFLAVTNFFFKFICRCREVEMEVNNDEITKLCQTIEEEIVKMFGDTGQKYKIKYRSLIFNLKDPKNRVNNSVIILKRNFMRVWNSGSIILFPLNYL